MTKTQKNLLKAIKLYMGTNNPVKYDTLKSLCIEKCKSFDTTFNALYMSGYVERFKTNDFSNQFVLTIKGNKK